MKIAVISYSLTGNNEALAKSVAEEFAAEHIKITEAKPRAMGTIMMDLIFKKTPKVQPEPGRLEDYDLILFFGPVWIGQAATPLRSYFKRLKGSKCRYAYVTISGGADGPNVKLAGEMVKRVGKEPIAVIDLHISDLVPPDPKPTRKSTMAYRLNNEEIKALTGTAVKTLRESI